MSQKSRVYWIGHYMVHREILFKFKIVNKEPLRIGSGREAKISSPVDLPVLKILVNGVERPYIPGSSLKGILRSFMDIFVRSHNGWTCPGAGRGICMEALRKQYGMDNLIKQGSYGELTLILWNGLCLSCKVFGSGGYRSKVYVYDALPEEEPRIGVKPGIAIDRRTGAAARGALYQVEYVEPGAVFNSGIRVVDIPNYALGIICLALNELNEGRLKLGGFKTRGFGRVEIKDLSIEVRLHTNLGGEVTDKRLVLKEMDNLDKRIAYEPINATSVEERAIRLINKDSWNFIETIIKETVLDKKYISEVVKSHKPKWVGSNVF